MLKSIDVELLDPWVNRVKKVIWAELVVKKICSEYGTAVASPEASVMKVAGGI
jgi:hypothetical protein